MSPYRFFNTARFLLLASTVLAACSAPHDGDDSGDDAVESSIAQGLSATDAAPLSGARVVGATSGSLSVTRTGTASYSIPLAVPPGPGGMTPALSLEYASDGADGVFGTRFSRFHAIGRRLRAAPAYMANLRNGRTGRYRGLNPAGTAMLVALLILLAISTVTGWMSTTVRFFGVPWVEDTHSYVSDVVIVLVVVHVLGVLLMCVLQKENLIRAMITGWKQRHR